MAKKAAKPRLKKAAKKKTKKATRKKTVRKKAAKRKTRTVAGKRLYRAAPKDSMIAGVCAGIAQRTRTDPVIIRLIALILALFDGIGILAYLIAWIVIPRRS